MNYELAKELKDAGFPQNLTFAENVGNTMYPDVHVPTLSELIEACGNGLQSLINDFYSERGGWIAFTNRKDERGERMEIWGLTPEEAVAKLWLALNKK